MVQAIMFFVNTLPLDTKYRLKYFIMAFTGLFMYFFLNHMYMKL